jgi:arylsulfatase
LKEEDQMLRKSQLPLLAVLAAGALLGWLAGSGRLALIAQTQNKAADTQPAGDGEVLPRPAQLFKGTIGHTAKESKPDFPKAIEAPKGAPNVLLILTDDVGFGASSTFGGPIPTPNYDKLAKNGLRYNMFHTTALCSPSRAALITGRNHHTCATGVITEFGTGFPGYNTVMPKSCGPVAEILKQNGWNTSWYGKNHNVPDWQ